VIQFNDKWIKELKIFDNLVLIRFFQPVYGFEWGGSKHLESENEQTEKWELMNIRRKHYPATLTYRVISPVQKSWEA
jgi:hypothetical protein